MTRTVRFAAAAAVMLALGACTVNTAPEPSSTPVIVQQPAVAPPPSTVIVKPAY